MLKYVADQVGADLGSFALYARRTLAAEQYATVNKYAGAFLQAFTFRSARRHDPLLAATALLRRLYAEKRRALPERVPITHLSQADRKLILGQEKPDRRLYEIAMLAALRDRLRSADIWVDGSRPSDQSTSI